MVALKVFLAGKRKRIICSIYLVSIDEETEKDMIELLEQLPAPMILLGNFKAHTPLWRSKKMRTRGRMREKFFNRYNLICINEKEETHYRAYDGCKSTIDLTIINLTIAPEYKWSKEYELQNPNQVNVEWMQESKRKLQTNNNTTTEKKSKYNHLT